MATFKLIEYEDASPEVRAVYDDIMTTRKTDWINNFWKALAHDPVTLRRTWQSIKEVMAPGALDSRPNASCNEDGNHRSSHKTILAKMILWPVL